MASQSTTTAPRSGFGVTDRTDNWWIGPLATALGLGAFGVYSTIRAVSAVHYDHGVGIEDVVVGNYLLSPFFSPLLIFPWMPAWFSPAFLILWAPGGFRLTCYYYRKAYYRSFFLDPPACAVGEPRDQYKGETRLFLFQNLHRFFLYIALIFIILLTIDVVHACIFVTVDGTHQFGLSVGSLVLGLCTTLLALYTFSCHSLRHLVGGKLDCFSCVAMGDARHKVWKGVSVLNKRHMLWAWLSLFMVGFADYYVYLVASGRIADLRIF